MKKVFLALMLLCASPCFGQLVLPSGTGVVQAPVDANGWLSYKLVLTQNVTSFSFVVIPNGTPPPSQAIRTVEFVENNSGGFTVTFASNISSPCTIITAANAVTVCQFLFDATNNTWSGIGGGGSGGVPGQFSVKTYGAVGDTKHSRNCTTATSSKVVTSTDNPWTAADVGKFLEAISSGGTFDVFTPARKIASFQSAGSITMDTVPDGGGSPGAGEFCKWFTQDDTAAFVAAQAAAKAASGFRPRDQSPTLNYPGQVYCPPGGYTVSGTIFLDAVNASSPTLGIGLFGPQGGSHCVIYPTVTFVGTVDPICSAVKEGLIYTCNTERTDIENIYIEGEGVTLGSSSVASGQSWIQIGNCTNCLIRNNTATDFGLSAGGGQAILLLSSFSGVAEYNFVQNGTTTGTEVACKLVNLSSALLSNNLCSNHPQSLVMSGVGTRGSGSGQVSLVNELTDECGGAAGTVPCTQISSSSVNYIGGTSFGGVPEIMSIDATSSVYMVGHNLQVFGSTSNNVPGVTIASGGLLEASESTLGSTGTSPIISGPAGATFVDVGGNSYINCVSGVCNPITATNFATRGFSGGIIPKSTQTHTPNTCYAVTGNLLATAQNLCILLLDQNYQVLNITAQSGGTTPANSSCTGAPVVTLSDGTRTATLTMTTGKTAWSSAVDVSTVNTVFASGATLTVSIGANTCATPPANVSVNYVLQSAVNP